MANFLEQLALGLRQAGGVLNPEVQRETFAADERAKNLAEQKAFDMQRMQQQFMLQQATPQAQMQRQQLENEVNFRRAVAEAGGDESKIAAASMQFGKPEVAVTLLKSKEDRAARAETAAQQLEFKRDQLEQSKEIAMQRITDAQQRQAFEQSYKTQSLQLQQQIAASREEGARESRALRAMQIAMMGDARQQKQANALDKAQAAAAAATDKNVAKLGVAMEKANVPTTDAVMRAAESAVAKDDVLAYLTGPKSLLPDFSVSSEVTKARQDIQKLFNITLKDRSGAAVTNQELERLKKEFGSGAFKTPGQLRDAVTSAREIVNSHIQGIAASYGAETLKAYNDNLVELGGTPLLSKPSGPAAIKSDADYAKLPSGAEFIAPDGSRRRKP